MHATVLVHPTRIESLNRKIGAVKARITKGKTEGSISATPVRSQLIIDAIRRPHGELAATWRFCTAAEVDALARDGVEISVTEYSWVTIEGEMPVIPGWAFVARYDFEHGLCLTNPMPGEQTPVSLREVPAERCDHCRARHHRTRSYLLRNDEGRHVVVGRSCLKDFLGHGSIEAIAALLDMESVIAGTNWSDSDDEGFAGNFDAIPTRTVLDMTAALVRVHGWVSRTRAMESDDVIESTASMIEDVLAGPPRFASPERMKAWRQLAAEAQPTDADRELTDAAVAWLAEQSPAGDYMHNLHTLVLENEAGVIRMRRIGIVASLIGTYHRHLAAERVERAKQEREADAEPVVEGRVVVEGVVVSVKVVDSGFGPVEKMLVEDDRGFRVYGTVPGSIEAKGGDRVRFTATLTRSEKDPQFGIFKRPAKAEVLAEEA